MVQKRMDAEEHDDVKEVSPLLVFLECSELIDRTFVVTRWRVLLLII
jgi:hypothetical protein